MAHLIFALQIGQGPPSFLAPRMTCLGVDWPGSRDWLSLVHTIPSNYGTMNRTGERCDWLVHLAPIYWKRKREAGLSFLLLQLFERGKDTTTHHTTYFYHFLQTYTMFDAIKNWFSPAKESAPESQWDSRTVQVQQPNSPATMTDSVNQQPVCSPQ